MNDEARIPGQPEDFHDWLAPLYRYGQVGLAVNSVTHDVNNYLGAMLAYAELIELDPSLAPNSKRMLGQIADSAKKCSSLISALTTVARKEKPDSNVVEPGQFLAQVVDLKRYDFKVARIALETEFPPNLPTILVDRPKLTMAVLYLLANALEAASDTEEFRVTVKLEANGRAVEIAVYNTGDPIAEEIRPLIFNPFFTTKAGLHLGLGLTLAREMAVAHQGGLTYDPDHGFVLAIPYETGVSS